MKENLSEFLPRDSTSFSGSTPGDKMKNTGEAGPHSLNERANSIFLPSVYCTPSFSSTKFLHNQTDTFVIVFFVGMIVFILSLS